MSVSHTQIFSHTTMWLGGWAWKMHSLISPQCWPTHCQKRKAFSLPPINSMLFCQPQKPRHNLLGTDTAQHPIISSSCLLGGRGCAFPSGENVPVKTIFLLAAALSHRQRGLVVQLLIVLAFFSWKWQSFHSTFCDVKMRIGLKHTLGSSPASWSLEGLA